MRRRPVRYYKRRERNRILRAISPEMGDFARVINRRFNEQAKEVAQAFKARDRLSAELIQKLNRVSSGPGDSGIILPNRAARRRRT